MERLRVTVSDPTDFVTAAGSNVFHAEVHGDDGEGALLLRMTEPVHWKGLDWRWFVARRSTHATCSLYGTAEHQATDPEWRDVPARWRGESPTARADLGG